uniref:Piezo type mechanosensitive ion channel component 2 n=1 Tax=Oncorhynchus kisutch TaxID=8019 RepID=A0A8C7L0D5_ONCKI
MASQVVCGLIFRLLLPVCLAAACLFRYNALSFIYLIYLLLIPLFPEPTKTTMRGHTGRLLKSLCFTSIAFLLLHIIYQVTVNSLLAGDNLEPNFNCSTWEKSVRQLGLESVRGADAGNGIRVFIPDIGMFVAGLVTWLLCLSLEEKQQVKDMSQQHNEKKEDEDEEDEGEKREEESTKMIILRQIAAVASKVKEIIGNLITTAGKVVVTILLGLTGIMLPSLTSAVYFFTFLGLCTWWSFCRTFHPLIFSCLCVLMAIFSAGHLVVLYLYQFQLFQELIPPGDSYASLFGISSVVQTDCSYTWMFRVNPALAWHHYVNPIMLLVLYYTLATLIRLWLQDPTDMVIADSSLPPSSLSTPPAERKDSSVYEVAGVRGEGSGEEMAGGALATAPVEEGGSPRANAAVTTFRFIMKQSYICALIAMMAWSITYVSWLTFVFLIWSCTLWMVRDRRKYAMITSPFMVFYGNLLIILQYIWSFEILHPVPGLFLKKAVPFRELGSKMLCLLSFWLLLRQALTERKESQREEVLLDIRVIHAHKNALPSPVFPTEKEEEVDESGGHREMMQVLGNTLTAMLNKYWIYICAGMFFFVSFQGRIVMYKIIYMMLLLFCVACYQVHYEWWRRMLKYFWMSVVFYTMLVLILVYTFQFDSSIHVWSNMTGMSKDKLEDLGLEKFSVPALFMRIFIPTSFLLVCILHLHYFHQHFLLLTDIKTVADKQKSTITRWVSHIDLDRHSIIVSVPLCQLVHLDGSLADISLIKPTLTVTTKEEEAGEKVQLEEEDKKEVNRRYEEEEMRRYEEPLEHCNLRSKWYLVVDRLTVLFLKFLQYFQQLQLTVWWLLELHIIKIVSSYILWVSIKEVSLFNYVFLVSWAFALPFSQFRPLASSVCTVWTCVIIVCKMLYQLTSINPSTYSNNCSMPLNYTDAQRSEMAHSLLYSAPVDPANWVGLRKFSPLLENLRNNLLILALLAFEVTIYRHQDLYRMSNNLTTPVTRTIFHDITRQHLDDGILNCAKYFINYFFYKFGLETCFLLAVNVIGQRMDFYAMLHAFGLIAVIYRRRRKAIAEIWPKYSCFLACMLSFQYFVCIGFPPAACKDYPWRFPSSSTDSNVIKWLYFPDFHTKPNPLFLLYDFMLLLCASLQRQVFEEENEAAVRLLAGDNVEICRDLDAASFSQHNPVPDFIHCRSYLDMLKVIMFSYLFWFVLTIIFITGTTRISIFCMGYLVACFYFLLFGGDLLLKPIKSILHYWDFLIAYNVFVITMKNILSILACGYIKVLVTDHCWLIQLFSLACTIKGYSKPEQHSHKQCELPSDEAGIIWDSICFAFLLLQRRVFMSYYFLHVVADIRSSQILASRGAELFQATIVKAVKARIEVEKKSMDLLKRQMDRIKSRQQKFKRGKERMLSLVQESGDAKDEEEDDEENTDKEKSRGKTKKQWWRPWVDHASMVRSGNYYLFETDSEEEEEEEDRKEEEPPKKSAFQRAIRKFASASLALPKCIIKLPKTALQYIMRAAKFVYHAWITDSKTAMKERSKEKRRFWKKYTEGSSSKIKTDVELAIKRCVLSSSPSTDNILKRVFNIVKFSWVLFLAMLDSFTAWINSMCQEHLDISTVLRIERCMLTHEVKKGNKPSRESIHVYYRKQMCKAASIESGLERTEEDTCQDCIPHKAERQSCAYLESHDPMVSHDSLSSAYTKNTLLCSCRSTLDHIDMGPDSIQMPRTSERAHPKLCKMEGLDLESTSSTDSRDSQASEHTQCTATCSCQGTTNPIKETGEDRDRVLETEPAGWGRGPEEAEQFSSSRTHHENRLVVVTPDEKSDFLSGVTSTTFPSLTHELTASDLLRNRMFYDEELEDSERFYGNQPALLQLLYALYNMLVAHSEMVCFLVIILNHMISASVATLVLPILIFLWAMLSVPRPSKRFWMTAIVYTEVTIVIKYFFQFGFFPFNQNIELDMSKPFHPPNIIGVEKKEGYVHYDLVQLLALFFHRSILKCHGLWDKDDPRGGGGETPMQHHPDREKRSSSRRVEKQASGGSSSLLESVRARFPRRFYSLSTSTQLRRKSSSAASHLSQRTLRSGHSRGDSVSSRQSLRRGDSVRSVQKRSKKEKILDKLREQLIKAKSFIVKKTLEIYIPIRQFFYNLIHPEYSAVTDVYVLMFLADTVDFIIIVFGFWAFGKHSAAADITSSLSEDQVPEAFLVMVLIQFGTMIIDRALYLRKTVMGKVIFQVILVFGIHFWMFFILPGVTERRFSKNTVAQLWYFVKCIYFGLSAYQIRCGYPTRVLGNFLTKSYNYLNLFLFQGFRLVPFLTELRAVMDWVWTDTTLSLSSWICVEDIYAHIFVLKCWRMSEKRYPQPRGQKKKKVVKYGMGGLIVMLLICIVWFPLLFMSLVKSVAGVVNKPLDVSVTITLGGFQPIFTMSAQQNQLKDISKADFSDFMNSYNYIPSAMQFLEAYTSEDVTVAELEGSSNSLWTISPPSRKNLMDVLSKEEYFPVTMSWTIQRNLSLGAKAEVATDKHVAYLDMTTRQEVIAQVFPCFLRAPSDSNAKPIEQLHKDNGYKNILLDLERTHNSSGEIQEWWIVDQPSKREAGLQLYVFSDKVSPPSLGFLAGYGIMGLYASVVLVIGKFVREFFSGISHSIMFEELPAVDRILKLCTDIFLVRETGELELEEDLYAKLIFLYRSPETMIKWTRDQKTK